MRPVISVGRYFGTRCGNLLPTGGGFKLNFILSTTFKKVDKIKFSGPFSSCPRA